MNNKVPYILTTVGAFTFGFALGHYSKPLEAKEKTAQFRPCVWPINCGSKITA